MAPKMGRNKTCIPTENEMQYGRNESGATGMPKNGTVVVPAASAAERASDATYGPRNTVPIVVLKAEFAQSYMAQPKISVLSFTSGLSVDMYPPKFRLVVRNTTRASISSFGFNVKKIGEEKQRFLLDPQPATS
jgi:hypothetical protein